MSDETPVMQKQISYVGFYPRLLATMIDVVVVMVVFYPVFVGLAWLTFGNSNPMGDIAPIAAPGLQDARSFGEVYEKLISNHELWNYVVEQKVLLKLLVQYVAQVVLLLAFIWCFWIWKGATPGKMLLSMRIADAKTFGKPSNGQFSLRLFGYFVSFAVLLLGFLWIAADKKRRGWHDRMAGTVVIKN